MLTACLQRVKSLFSLVPSSVLLLISVSFWGSLSVPPPFSRTKRHYLECPNKVLDKLLSVGMSVISEYPHTYTSFSSLSVDVIMIFTATFVLSFHPLRRLNKKRKKRKNISKPSTNLHSCLEQLSDSMFGVSNLQNH